MNLQEKLKLVVSSSLISFCIGALLSGVIVSIIFLKINEKKSTETQEVTESIILEKINDQAFLVTTNVITDEEVTITIDQGSEWSNFWWGHEIVADGTMKVDVGVNLANLDDKDISVDHSRRIITISLPEAEVYEVSLIGKISAETKSGILKQILASDSEQDFNLALAELQKSAEEAVKDDSEIMEDSRESAKNLLESLFQETGYKVEFDE
ncbi:DUF4230 domain-containing protein [Candidatus Dojkabacteria bacterium]|nr:DUF4230 domain-containing protein [Candidatus Dojkabacteria bacterium]